MISQAFQGYQAPPAYQPPGAITTLPFASENVLAEGAPLNEQGYLLVASGRNTSQMTIFIRRVIEAMGGRVLRDGDLNGLAPYYSGERGTQSYARLVEELTQKSREPNPWLALGAAVPVMPVAIAQPVAMSGSAAPLSEAGYQGVAALRCTNEMKVFIHRVIAHMGGEVVNEGGLSGFAPFYSGEKAVQSYERLIQELGEKARERHPFVRFANGRPMPVAQAVPAAPRQQGWSSGAMAGTGIAGVVAGALAGVALDEALHHSHHAPPHHQKHHHRDHHDHWHHGRRWNPYAWCDGFSAQDRMEWLMREKGYTEHRAREQVMGEFKHAF